MDIDVFPNTVEYWGPPGMAFFRNVQVRWMPVKGDSRVTVALERPGASADAGNYAERIELDDVRGKFPYPDLSAEARLGRGWGYVELAGILGQPTLKIPAGLVRHRDASPEAQAGRYFHETGTFDEVREGRAKGGAGPAVFR